MVGSVTKFQARHGTLAYVTGAVTWDTGTEASDETATASVAEVKDITVTPPEQEVEQITCLGATAQTLGANARTTGGTTGPIAATFQNAAMVVKNATNWKMEGTLVLKGDESFNHILGLDAGTAINALAHRYAVGNLTSNNWAKNLLGTLRLFLNNGSEEVNLVMTNSFITKIGEVKPTGSDGHYEVSFSAECLPREGFIEFLD